MPSIQTRPVDVSQVIRDLQARVLKLETFRPSAMTLLTSSSNPNGTLNGPYPYQTVFGTEPDTLCGPFTLLRPTLILLIASMTFYASGGTANYIAIRAIISTSNTGPNEAPANDIGGVSAQTTQGTFSVVGVANYTGARAFTMPAGTYYAMQQTVMQGGAATTITEEQNDTFVWALAG